jgi:colanic acid biosynthesis glycosyl transferase WcaI
VKILVVTQYFWPEKFRINDLVQELAQRGHIVSVLTGVPNIPEGKVFPEYSKDRYKFMNFSGARVVRVPMFPRGLGKLRLVMNYFSFAVSASTIGLWKCRNDTFDAVFVFSPSPITVGLPALVLGKLKKAPVLIWVLDLWPESLRPMGINSRIIFRFVAALVRFIYARSNMILGQSKSFVTSIANYCDDASKIKYLPSWSESVFEILGSDWAPEIPFDQHKFTILFAGNLGEAQDIPALLEAIEALRFDSKFRWIFVGGGRKGSWFQKEVRFRGLQKQVFFFGSYPVERMPSFYLHADALLVSLKDDQVYEYTIPGKVQTYLMAGIPILAMLNGEGAKVVQDAGAGFTCKAGDGIALSLAARRMSLLPAEQRKKMGYAGKNFAKREFDRVELISQIERLMNEAITKKNFS